MTTALPQDTKTKPPLKSRWSDSFQKLEELTTWILTHSDALLAIAVAGIVAMMILPLPTWLLDILITCNISIAVLLLLVVLYVPEPLAIASFPTILLLTTLYRLGLNVSSTRLILLQANAGHVINAFGNFVVSGNYVVGAVVFLILTIIQFIVIAKGSERVAEVAARFTLDAMPGKQMSIDADLRSGIIDSKEAKRRRANLEREAQFYGAMDGGMRFVKGDAIAGICITVINIIAGLIIGVLQMGMNVAESAKVFTLLTIGDGLVSQIPALVISTSAGFVITRVASEERGMQLGTEVGRQVFANPRALKIVAVLLIGLGIIPGMPFGPFVLMGVITGFMGWSLSRGTLSPKMLKTHPMIESASPLLQPSGKTKGEEASEQKERALLCPVSIDLSPEIVENNSWKGSFADTIKAGVQEVRNRLFNELGVNLPPVHIRIDSSIVPYSDVVIKIKEITTFNAEIPSNKVFVYIDHEQLEKSGIEAEQGVDPSGRVDGWWVDESTWKKFFPANNQLLEPDSYILFALEESVRKRCDEIIGIQEIQEMIDILESTSPALVRSAVPKPVDLHLLTEISRRLVTEGISLRYMEKILEVLLTWVPHEKDPVTLVELIRSSMKRYITQKFTNGDGKLEAFVISRSIEDVIGSSIHKTQAGSFLALSPSISKEILNAIGNEISSYYRYTHRDAIIVTTPEIRRYLRKLIENDYPRVAVLSFAELDPSVTLIPIGEIAIGTSK